MISGEITGIAGNKIWVKENLPPPAKNKTYQIKVKDDTPIFRPLQSINFYFKTRYNLPNKSGLSDLKVGQTVRVGIKNKLWLSFPLIEPKVSSIQLPAIKNRLKGKITGIKENTLLVKGYLSLVSEEANPVITPSPAPEFDYTVSVSSETEIVRFSVSTDQTLSPVLLSFSDLEEGMQIVVVTDTEIVSSQPVKALKIRRQ